MMDRKKMFTEAAFRIETYEWAAKSPAASKALRIHSNQMSFAIANGKGFDRWKKANRL